MATLKIDQYTFPDENKQPLVVDIYTDTFGHTITVEATHHGQLLRYELPGEHYSDRFGEKISRAWALKSDFRAQFIQVKQVHPTRIITLQGKEVEVDTLLVDVILELNDCGFHTKFCCQGDQETKFTGQSYTDGYISFLNQMPHDLYQTAQSAGFMIHGTTLRSTQTEIFEHDIPKCNLAFLSMLEDWRTGQLDVTGKKYHVVPTPFVLPSIPSVPIAELGKNIHTLIKKGAKATFSDYATLRCGRDAFSKMKLEELKSKVGDLDLEPALTKFPESKDFCSVLRWYLRGLPLTMAMRKVEVGLEIEANSKK